MNLTPAQAARIQRAKTECIAVTAVDGDVYRIRGASGSEYQVARRGDRLVCTCPDSRRRGTVCKHCCLVALRTLDTAAQLMFFANHRLPPAGAAPALTARNTECCCCLNDLGPGAAVCMSCRQGFHPGCLRHWTRHALTCPTCRAPITA